MISIGPQCVLVFVFLLLALIFSFRLLRFAARVLTLAHDCYPSVFHLSLTIFFQVVFGRPGLLLSSASIPKLWRNVTLCLSSLHDQSSSIFDVWCHCSCCSLLCSPEFVGRRWSEASSCTCTGNCPASASVFVSFQWSFIHQNWPNSLPTDLNGVQYPSHRIDFYRFRKPV